MIQKVLRILCITGCLFLLTACGGDIQKEDTTNESQEESVEVEVSKGTTLTDTSFVMIYNPYIYQEENVASMNTGDFGSQIVVGMNKAGNLGTEVEIPMTWSQEEINADVDISIVNREGVRAQMADPTYELQDAHTFFYCDETMKNRIKGEFICCYVGEHCYVWSLDGSISEEDAKLMGQEFDKNIYQQDTDTFAVARFTENGGKVHLLFHPMKEGIGGYFTTADIYSSVEVPDEAAQENGFNTDHAIVHINNFYVTENPEYAKSTLTHEFQHLICASNYFQYIETPKMDTWLNEAMSAFAEDLIYPGIKEEGNYHQFFYLSEKYQKGQSIYNFSTADDKYIGAYGAVYLFSQYLEQETGVEIYKNLHDYWRNSYSATVTEAEALSNAVPEEFFAAIDEEYEYPEAISSSFATEYEEWMSKLTLDFYVETLSAKLANLTEVEDKVRALMLYSELSPVDIEGGGRIVVAVQNGTYEIPADADPNLIYVGLNADFEVVDVYSAQ